MENAHMCTVTAYYFISHATKLTYTGGIIRLYMFTDCTIMLCSSPCTYFIWNYNYFVIGYSKTRHQNYSLQIFVA
jgi:hypothetical protein